MQQVDLQKEDLLISLGDIVDRGNKSVECYNYFKNRENSIVLMGNHERKHQKGILNYSQEIVKVQFAEQYPQFVEWTNELPYFYETEEAIIVHAYFEHDTMVQNQKEEVLSGTTSGSKYLDNKYEEGTFWTDYYTGIKPIIYGHHVVGETPKIHNNTYGIDTGGCHGGRLTLIELPGFKVHQVKVKTDYWKEEQSKWQIPVLKAKNWEGMKISQVHQQIEKLGYKEEEEVKLFLESIKRWLNEVENLYERVKCKIESKVRVLKTQYPDDFNQKVSQLKQRTFLFKANSGNLTTENIKKTLDTPNKIIGLALELEMDNLPSLENE